MNREVNTPNIVVDDNYRMLVKRLTRRYAERGASVYTDAEAIEQERSDARARAIAPDAYRISGTLGDNPEMYKSGNAAGSRYMTTDDYLVYFSKCHDTFDAANYYNLHADASVEDKPEEKPRVLVNRKRLEMVKKGSAAQSVRPRARKAASEQPEERKTAAVHFGHAGRKGFAALAAAAASIAILVGGVFAVVPANEANHYSEKLAEDDIMNLSEHEGQDILQNRE